MIIVYIFIIGIPALCIYYCVRKIIKARRIQSQGISVEALVTQVQTQRFNRTYMDLLTLEYTAPTNGLRYPATATTTTGQYKAGDRMPVIYLAENPAQYAFDKGEGYVGILIFFVVLFFVMIFASVKIDEMVKASNF